METVETPKSSNIKRFSFESDILIVEFKQGTVYEYRGVSENIFRELRNIVEEGGSAGKWISVIKERFPHRRLR